MQLKHNSVSCLLRVAKYLSGNVNKKTIKPSVKAKTLVKK